MCVMQSYVICVHRCYAVRCHVFTWHVCIDVRFIHSLSYPVTCLEVLTEPADFGVLSVSDLLVGERGSKRLPAIGKALRCSKSLSLWPQFPIDEEQHGMSLSVQHSAVASLCRHVHLSLDCWNQIKFLCSCGFRTCHSDCSCMCAFREFSLQQYLKNPRQNVLLPKGRKKHLVRLRCSN